MRRTIRNSTFETNSSAVHELVISMNGMEPSNLKIRKKDGKIRVPLRYWGKEDALYTTQLDKLSYIVTRAYWGQSAYQLDKSDLENAMENNYALQYIQDAICEYTGAKGLELYVPRGAEVGFDHQEQPDYADDMNGFVNVYSASSIQNFVFNKYIGFSTGCD